MSSRPGRPFATLRWGGTLLAAAALVALGVVNGAPAPAQAVTAGGYDQMSGIGSTASFVHVKWTQGLLDSNNQPISNPGTELDPNANRPNDTGLVPFMNSRGEFNNLEVTVSQTQDIGHGGITVTWTGGQKTVESGGIQKNFLQMMECYGNAPTGPSPENCEFGSSWMVSGLPGTVSKRTGNQCTSPTYDTNNPTPSRNGNSAAFGCDPFEPTIPTHDACAAAASSPDCVPGDFSIPFVPQGDPTSPLYQNELPEAFDQFSTNEIDVATTRGDGSGEQQFETVTSVQSSGLGCGQPQSDGTPQGCWLVIVPRGDFEPNGYDTLRAGNNPQILSSPLSAVNWAQRIQVHLDYAPLPNFCLLGGNARESLMEGTQLVARAVQSWELKLNQDAQCKLIYHLASTPEQQVTNDFSIRGNTGNGLAFTTVPIGSDRLRNGTPPPTLPNVVYAPVAVVALDLGFHIDETVPNDTTHTDGYLTTSIKMSPQLLARALTQSYRFDLPDYDAALGMPGPAWSQSNPPDVSSDKQFQAQAFNPEVIPHGFAAVPLAPLDTIDHSAYYQQIWQWLQADPTASGWLGGAPDPAVTVNPAYQSQNLGKPPAIDSIPRAYPTCLDLGPSPSGVEERRCSIDMLPYVANFDSASAAVLAATPLTFGNQWDAFATAPDGSPGYWDKNPPEPPGQIFEWAIDATPYLAAYGIVPAMLCSDSGSNCISPTVTSVAAAVANAKPDSAGLLQVNPASPGAGAYPLTEVVYAAVRTDATAQQLTDYADFLSFAVGNGQSQGQAGGNLPPGYLPLPASLQAQANASIAKLRALAGGPPPTATPTASTTSPTSSSTSTPAGGPSTGGGGGGGGGGPQPPATPAPANGPAPSAPASTAPASSPASGATPTGPVIVPPTIQLAGGNTPHQPVGPVRQALVVVLVIGISGAGGGILLRRGRMPRWPGRTRP